MKTETVNIMNRGGPGPAPAIVLPFFCLTFPDLRRPNHDSQACSRNHDQKPACAPSHRQKKGSPTSRTDRSVLIRGGVFYLVFIAPVVSFAPGDRIRSYGRLLLDIVTASRRKRRNGSGSRRKMLPDVDEILSVFVFIREAAWCPSPAARFPRRGSRPR